MAKPLTAGTYSAKEAAQLFGVHEKTVRRWVGEGTLEAIRPGGKLLRITYEAAERFIKRTKIKTKGGI